MSKIDRIKISEEFHIGGKGLWLAAECPVAPDENPIEQFVQVRDVLMDTFKALNPGAEIAVSPEYSHLLPIQQVEKTPEETRIGLMASDILNCGNLTVLRAYNKLVADNPELQSAYQKRYAELTTQKQQNQ